MVVTINNNDLRKYPKLMKSKVTGIIVYMVDYKKGYVIDNNKSIHNENGDYSIEWNMDYFIDYNEELTIKN